MVTGSGSRSVLVTSLDGALVDVDSFRAFVAFMGRWAFHSGYFDLLMTTALWMALRGMRVVSADGARRRVLRSLGSRMDDNLCNAFVDKLLERQNQEVARMIDRYRRGGYAIVLATSAPACYAEAVAARLGFDHCCATAGYGSRDTVVRGHDKLDAVRGYLDTIGAELHAVITCRTTDLPLMLYNQGVNVVVGRNDNVWHSLQRRIPNLQRVGS